MAEVAANAALIERSSSWSRIAHLPRSSSSRARRRAAVSCAPPRLDRLPRRQSVYHESDSVRGRPPRPGPIAVDPAPGQLAYDQDRRDRSDGDHRDGRIDPRHQEQRNRGEDVAQASGNDLRLLRQHCDALPQMPAGKLAHRHPAEAHVPCLQLDHPGEETGDRRLAAAGAPHQPQHRPRGQPEAHLTQHRGAGDVGEAHAVEFQRAGCDGQSRGAVVGCIRLRQQFVDADQAGLRLLELLHLCAQRRQRPSDQLAVAVHQPHCAEGQQPGPVEPGRHAQSDRHPADEQQRVGQGHRVAGDLRGDLAWQPVRQNPLETGAYVPLSAQWP